MAFLFFICALMYVIIRWRRRCCLPPITWMRSLKCCFLPFCCFWWWLPFRRRSIGGGELRPTREHQFDRPPSAASVAIDEHRTKHSRPDAGRTNHRRHSGSHQGSHRWASDIHNMYRLLFLNKNVVRFFFMKCAERDGGDGRRLESVHGIGEQRRQRSAERRRLNRPGHRRRRAFPRRQRFDVRV